MLGNELTEDFIKNKFPESEGVTQDQSKKLLDIHEFEDLINDYQESQTGGTFESRIAARNALKSAYRAALKAAGQ